MLLPSIDLIPRLKSGFEIWDHFCGIQIPKEAWILESNLIQEKSVGFSYQILFKGSIITFSGNYILLRARKAGFPLKAANHHMDKTILPFSPLSGGLLTGQFNMSTTYSLTTPAKILRQGGPGTPQSYYNKKKGKIFHLHFLLQQKQVQICQ